MKRHFFALLMSLAMIISLLPVTAMAENETQENEAATQAAETLAEPATSEDCGATEDDSLTWALTKNDGEETYTLTISGKGAMADYTVGGAPWHVALGAAANRKLINKIELPNGLTHIGDNAFLQASVTDVEIPSTVISIGTNAFWNCNTIRTTIPASVQDLGATAFYGTFVVNVDANSPYFCSEEDGKILYNKDKTTLYQVSQYCADEFTIPSTVTTINDFAMNGCANVTGELVIPNNVQTIGKGAFEKTGFTSLTLGSSVKEIGQAAFKDCTKMTDDLVIPASVTTIGENAFAGTGFNGKLDFQAQIEEFPAAIFKGLNFTSVSFSDSVKTIGDRAFENCKQLATVTFGQGLETIGSYAFEGSGISGELKFPDSLKRIKTFAFSNCLGITEIDFPEGNATIEYGAFTGDTGIQKIKIPLSEIQFDKLNNGGYWIFTQYTENKLETIVVGTAPTENSMSLFANSLAGLKTIVIGTGVSKINNYAFQNANLLESALYPSDLNIGNEYQGNQNLINVGTKYTVANGNMEQGDEQTMLTFETPNGKTCPTVTYLSTNESAVTVDENGKIKAVGSVGQKATIKAQYDGTTFAKVDVTIGTSADGDFYSIDPTIADQTYTGAALEPAVKVTKNGEVISDTEYSVKYSSNTNVGTATATVKVGDTVIGTATFNIVKATPTLTIAASPESLRGGGKVTLTVSGAPAKVVPTCEGVTITENSDGTFSAVLPNRTATYTFTVNYAESENYTAASAECKVSVTRRYSSSTTVTPEPTPEPTPEETVKFSDVSTSAYYYDAVKWAVENGVTDGVSATLFAPYEPCTRGQIVTFLWRAAGSPEPKTASSFADVPASAYYAKAVAWAVENGITNGMTETTFAPDATCTRGQSVTFLYRALKGTASGSANFTDVKSDAFYADAINWAVANNVTNGTSNTTFSPNADCTRAEIVTFLYRADQAK